MTILLAVLSGMILAYCFVAKGLSRLWMSGPIVGMTLGVIGSSWYAGHAEAAGMQAPLGALAELALAFVLFRDGASTDLRALRSLGSIPSRLLLLGLPLCILLGLVAGVLIWPDVPLLELTVLAVLLAPTDAALGSTIMEQRDVPLRIRQNLNVESGLNDGLSVPVFLLFLTLATEQAMAHPLTIGLTLFVKELGIGAAVGILMTILSVLIGRWSIRRGWFVGVWRDLPFLMLPLCVYTTALSFSGSGFIATFVSGVTLNTMARTRDERLLEEPEAIGQALSLVSWAFFGAVMVRPLWPYLTPDIVLYALLSLTVIRMVPVVLVLLGTDLHPSEKLFVGWFGPRGLASIVFMDMLHDANLPHDQLLLDVGTCTVLCSVVLHGLTATPLSRALVRAEARENAEAAKGSP